MPRLFIAIPLSAEVKDLLAPLRTDLPAAHWVAPEQLHLTLHFLGEVDHSFVPALQALVTTLTTPRFTLRTAATGVFPSLRAPRVLWLGLSPSGPLQQLHAELTVGIARLGLVVDDRTYHPHLTLARLKNSPPAAVAQFLRQSPAAAITVPAEQVILYASTLHPGGVNHQPLATGLLPAVQLCHH